ncbi:unnamed protein product [Rhizophagus irregularis]|nr:unnamed protein product [Rhizophagus irregularis]
MSLPQIVIDPDEELRIVCRLLFYNIPGFHPNAKKLHKACQEEGYSFRLQDTTKWLKHQYIYQIYQQPLPCKAEASFSKIKIPNKVQYAIEGRLAEGERLRLWNKILKKYIDFMNNSKTRLIGMTPAHAMTLEEVESQPSSKPKRVIGRYEEVKLKKSMMVRYLLKPGELEGDHRHQATDPYWSLRVYKIKRVVIGRNPPQPVLYYFEKIPPYWIHPLC